MMTRQHYKAIAEIIARHAHGNLPLIRAFSAYLAADNPRFDEDRFKEACWITHCDVCGFVYPNEDNVCQRCGHSTST